MRERRWALLALAQYQVGRQGDALRTLHQARTALVTELGVDPGSELVALEQAILRQDPSLVAAAALPEPSAICPYLGLVPYDVDDSEGFFGRDGEVEACLARLSDGRRADGGRTLGQREVVAGSGRRGRLAAAQRPSVSW